MIFLSVCEWPLLEVAALDTALRGQLTAPPAPAKKPAASTPPAPAQPAPAEPPKEPEALEFTPKDGKLTYTKKKDGPGYKPG